MKPHKSSGWFSASTYNISLIIKYDNQGLKNDQRETLEVADIAIGAREVQRYIHTKISTELTKKKRKKKKENNGNRSIESILHNYDKAIAGKREPMGLILHATKRI